MSSKTMKCSTMLFLVLLIPTTVLSQNMFEIDMNCSEEICDKLENEFINAGQTISNNLMLTAKIVVEVSYEPLNPGVFAGTTPSLILHGSPDGVERLHTTALLKQLNVPVDEDVDIKMSVNSDEEAAYWFQGDPDIGANQIDVAELALHELIHGLGFTSTWNLAEDPAFDTFLTPRLNDGDDGGDEPVTFDGFFETQFDGFLIDVQDSAPITDIAKALNGFAPKGTQFDNLEALYDQLLETQGENAELMLTYATTDAILGFKPAGSDAVVLDTSDGEFIFGVSINHFSQNDYVHTSDFLMTPYQEEGFTLQEQIDRTGNAPGGGIGPQLRSILKTLGYTVNPNPPPMAPTSNENNTQKVQKKIKNDPPQKVPTSNKNNTQEVQENFKKIPRKFFRRKI